MPLFDDFLITADYDHTLTGPDGTVPERNLEAIVILRKMEALSLSIPDVVA